MFREISPAHNDGVNVETIPGTTGVLINGVEVLNYKSNDIIRYGRIDEIEVTSSGSNYDIITPPVLKFRILGNENIVVKNGTIFKYRLFLHGFPFIWRSKI